MFADSTLLNRSRALTLLALGAALVLCSPLAARAQTKTYCGPEVKDAVAQALAGVEDASDAEKLAVEADLYTKYQACAKDAALVPATSTFFVAARQCGAAVSNLGTSSSRR